MKLLATTKALKSIGLIRRTSSNATSVIVKKTLYITRSTLLHCSPLWWPYLIKDILLLEIILGIQ